MSDSTQAEGMGTNRTGTGASPLEGKATIEGATEGQFSSSGDDRGLAKTRIEYARWAEPVGSMPEPSRPVSDGLDAQPAATLLAPGAKTTAFLDKLGERLAFERTSCRLYQAVISKHDALGPLAGGPSRDDLEQILAEELQHLGLLQRTLEDVGADPTAMTPSADLTAVAMDGVLPVVTDPRTGLGQCLAALRLAELADNEGWQTLIDVAEELGQPALAAAFRVAHENEQQHLALVRQWSGATLAEQSRGRPRSTAAAAPRRALRDPARARAVRAPRSSVSDRAGGSGVEGASGTRSGTPSEATETVSADAIELLRRGHRQIEELFKRLDKEATRTGRRMVFAKLAEALAIHMAVEEKVFYPAVKEPSREPFLLACYKDHAELRRGVVQLLRADEYDVPFSDEIKRIKIDVLRHLSEQESELFPAVVSTLGAAQLASLAGQMVLVQAEVAQRGDAKEMLGEGAEVPAGA